MPNTVSRMMSVLPPPVVRVKSLLTRLVPTVIEPTVVPPAFFSVITPALTVAVAARMPVSTMVVP